MMKGILNNQEIDVPERFLEPLKIIQANGFKPLAVAIMVCEDTFCFETEEEATNAFDKLETNPKDMKNTVQGWWYGKEYFLQTVKEYSKEHGYEVEIIWLIYDK